jgi:phage baseplate assembly protein V
MVASQPVPRRGLLSSVDPNTGKVRVKTPSLTAPSGYDQTGWLPYATQSAGEGWGVYSIPLPGTQVVVLPCEGDSNSSVVMAAHWSKPQPPPPGYSAGEMWLYHQSGSFVKLTNDGKITLQDKAGSFVALTNDGKITLQDQSGSYIQFTNDGNISLHGNLYVDGDITGKYGGSGFISLRLHTHSQGVDSHGDLEEETNPPTPGT